MDGWARSAAYSWVGTPVKKIFLEDHQGKIWIGTSNGLFRFDPVTGRARMIRNIPGDPGSLSHNYVTSLLEDGRKNLWISTMGGGLNLLTDENKFSFRRFRHDPRNASSICTDSILSLSLVNSGKMWIGGRGEISMMLPGSTEFKSWKFLEYPAQAPWPGRVRVNEVFEDHNGGIWLFQNRLGVGRLFLDIGIFIVQDIPSGFQHEICMDRAGSFWIGTIDNYAFRIDLQAPRIIHCRYDFFRPWIYEDRNGTIWAPNNNLKLNLVGGIRELTRAQLPGNISFTAMYEDPEGILWFAQEAIYRYNPKSRSLSTFRLSGTVYEKVKISGIRYLQGDKNGNLWFGNRDFLAFLNTKTGKDELISPANFRFMVENDWQVEQILVDSHNIVWVATLEGICRIEPDHGKRLTRLTFNPSKPGTLGDNAIFRLAEDRAGRIWVLTMGSGLFLLNRDSGTFQMVNPFQNFPFISFHEMMADKKGNLWFLHTAGLSCFSTIDRSIRHFSFPKKTFDATINQISNGNIYIVPRGEEGTYILNPDSIRTNSFIPPVYITSMHINQKPYPNILNSQNNSGTNIIRLKHRENSVTFTFAALNYTEPENNQYKYRMIGMEEDTTLAGTNHTAEYRNMRPGKYSFWVTGSNNDGLWNRAGTSVSFVIRPPWSQSLTAWLIYGLFLILFLYGYIKWRTRQLVIEKKDLEKQVGERTQQIEMQKNLLEQRNQQIVEMDKIKTRFFTNISHEFRTPLTLIQGPVEEMLERPHRMEKDRNFLKLIYKNTRHLLNLVNQLLDIAKIDSSKMKLELAEADVIDFLRTVAASFSSMAEVKCINYSYQLPIVVRHTWFDSDKIEKIVNNLLSNAFKFTSEGGKIILQADYVPGQHGLPEMLSFSVSDTGIGIPADLTEKIFDRFYQVEENLKRDSSGTGLGLSLTRDLVHLMHGEIFVTSEPGKGSTFKVNIPLGKDHLQPEEYCILPDQVEISHKVIRHKTVEEDIKLPVGDPDLSEYFAGKPVVLLVEDNKDIRQHISTHFYADYNVLEAPDGKAGLHLALENMPDLVITDLMMPHMSGSELCLQLKTDERTSHIPVIMLTARASLDDKLKGLETGADDYVSKPFNMKELLARSQNLIEQRRKLRERFSREISLEPGDIAVTSVDEKFLQRAISIVDKHISEEDFTVTIFNEEMNMSRSTLFRKLYAITGQSPVEFINTIRLKKAAVLLRNNAGNVATVALEVGFSNPSYFARIFKKQFGIAPREYAMS